MTADAEDDKLPRATETPELVIAEQERAYDKAHRRKRWHQRMWVRVLLVLGVLIVAAALISRQLYVTAPCVIVAGERAYVRAPIAGVLASIEVDEGSRVKKGDVIARLDDRVLASERRKHAAEAARIAAELEHMRDSQAAARTPAEPTSVRALVEHQIAVLAADLERAQAELELADKKLAEMIVIRAPIDGVVLTPKLREHLHAKVEPGDTVCEIVDTRTVRAEIFAPEREADSLAAGMAVVVKVESHPTEPFEGTVDFIAPAVEKRDDENVVRVVATLANPDGVLRHDMNGYGEIACGKRSLLDLATRRIVRWVRLRFLI